MSEQSKELQTIESGAVIAPEQFISQAIQSGADVSVLNGLFELKQKHDAAEAKKSFVRAMQKFQEIKPVLVKKSKVNFTTQKGTTDYNFCGLPDIEKALKGPLSECGLTYRFENLNRDDGFGIRCVVTHVEGHSEFTEMFAPRDDSGNKNQIQGIGSTSTYLMRYTLIAAFALTTADEDNDGQTSGDLPYAKLLAHNEALREHFHAVGEIKSAIGAKDYDYGVEIAYGLGKDALQALWIAPTYGGIFTTHERKTMKEDPEWLKARDNHFAAQEAGETP